MRKLKLLSLALAALFMLAGVHNAYAVRITNKPTIQSGSFKTWTYDFGTGITAVHSGTAITNPAGTTTYVPQETQIVAQTVLYGFSVVSDTAGGTAAIYDSNTVGAISATQGTSATSYSNVIVDEISTATQYNVANSDWVAPYRLVNGFTLVSINNPNVCVYYE